MIRVRCVGFAVLVGACGSGTKGPSDTAVVDVGSIDLGAVDASGDASNGGDAGPRSSELPAATDLRAFPSAEGFGAHAAGGRGGQVLHVTNLDAGGPGSLQAAIDVIGPRIIVFDVSGHIPDVIVADHGQFTLAGQTAPSGISVAGLMLQGDVVCEEATAPNCPLPSTHPEDFVVRHLRVRVDPTDPDGGGDGVRFHHAVNGVLDHVSIGNAADEAIQVSFSRDLSIQHTMLAETVGNHGRYGGMLVNYSDVARGFPQTGLSIHHNLWVRIYGRYPEINRENVVDASVADLEISNNVYWGTRAPLYVTVVAPGLGHDLPWRLNVVGNRAFDDPGDGLAFGFLAIEPPPDLRASGTMFLSDTHIEGVAESDYRIVYNNNDFDQAIATMGTPWYATTPSWAAAARLGFPAITYTPSTELVGFVERNVGAFPRDRLDLRMTGYLRTGTFDTAGVSINGAGDIVVANLAGDATAVGPFLAAPPDTDRDGIADAWETAHGLDPSDPSDGSATGLSFAELGVAGYTNVEVYLDALAHEREAGR